MSKKTLNGWIYSDGGNFRQRFPEWIPINRGAAFQLLIVCESLEDGRWEPFVSNPQVFWENGGIVE